MQVTSIPPYEVSCVWCVQVGRCGDTGHQYITPGVVCVEGEAGTGRRALRFLPPLLIDPGSEKLVS